MQSIVKFIVFLLGIVFMRAGWFMTLPFLAIFLSRELHYGPVEIGIILSLNPLMSCIAGFFGGILVDRIGNKAILLVCLSTSAVLFLIFGWQTNFLIIGALNGCLGILRGFFETASKTYIIDSVPLAWRSQAYSWRYVAVNLGSAIGPLIGAEFINVDIKILFDGAAVCYLATFLTYIFIVHTYPIIGDKSISFWGSLRSSMRTIAADKPLLLLILITTLVLFAFAQLDSTLPLTMATKNLPHYTHIFSLVIFTNCILAVLLQPPLDLFIHRFRLLPFAYVAAVMFVIAFVTFAFAYNEWMYLAAAVFMTFGEIINVSLSNNIIDKVTPAEMKGAYIGAFNFSTLGWATGPFVGGLLLKYFGGVPLFIIVAILSGMCCWLYRLCHKYSAENNIHW